MKRLLYMMPVLASFLCVSCAKEVVRTVEVDLGKKTVDVEAGSFPVKVTTEGVWYARSQSPWIHVSEELHKSEGTFLVSYDSNASSEGDWRFNRIGKVQILTYDGATAATISVWQRGLSPVITFDERNVIPASGGACKVSCRTTLTDGERKGISLSCPEPWITSLTWGPDGRSVEFVAEPGNGREAQITLTHTDAWGIVTEAVCKVRQEE